MLAMVSLSSCCEVWPAGATATKKRVSKRRDDSPDRGDPVAHPHQIIDRRAQVVLGDTVSSRSTVPSYTAWRWASAGWPSATMLAVWRRRPAARRPPRSTRGSRRSRSPRSPSPSASSTLPPGNTYMPPANAAAVVRRSMKTSTPVVSASRSNITVAAGLAGIVGSRPLRATVTRCVVFCPCWCGWISR